MAALSFIYRKRTISIPQLCRAMMLFISAGCLHAEPEDLGGARHIRQYVKCSCACRR
jgi:hypothetical protein